MIEYRERSQICIKSLALEIILETIKDNGSCTKFGLCTIVFRIRHIVKTVSLKIYCHSQGIFNSPQCWDKLESINSLEDTD